MPSRTQLVLKIPDESIYPDLLWQDEDITDTANSWEMTVFLVADSPADTCTVDVTPRHRRAFNPKPGATFKWTNSSIETGKVIQSGTVTTDKWGLVTLKKFVVTKGRNRIGISK